MENKPDAFIFRLTAFIRLYLIIKLNEIFNIEMIKK